MRNKKFSAGNCHGDLNYRNILVVHDGRNIFPVLIDFARICQGVSPAKDWAKFEREIKFRLLRDAEPDPAVFGKALQEIETCCDNCIPLHAHASQEKALKLISLIRSKYSEGRTNISDAPHLEYLFFLFYTTLAYAVHEEIEGQPLVQHAVLDSANRLLEQIDLRIPSDIEYKYLGITGTEAPVEVAPPVIPQVPEAYRTWIETHCLKTELGKLVEDQEVFVRIRMPEIFIPLYADDPDRKERLEREGQKTVDIEELVSRYDYLAVRGQAGSGKMTLLKHLAYTVISGINPFGMNDCLPVLVFLDDLEKIVRKIPGPVAGAALAERFLEEYFKETGNGLDLQRVKAYSVAQRTVFLFDGLDEIEPRHRKSVLASLINYANRNPGNRLIFSGRPSGIDADMPQQFAGRIADINGLVASQKGFF